LHATLANVQGTTTEPVVLREDDEVTVFSLTEFRAPRYVALSGAVRNPGQYPYRDGMTLRDLVLMAGGLHASARYATRKSPGCRAIDRTPSPPPGHPLTHRIVTGVASVRARRWSSSRTTMC
jgi:NADH:ubiquinone oxidoreductase subunit F (NADH-binding)